MDKMRDFVVLAAGRFAWEGRKKKGDLNCVSGKIKMLVITSALTITQNYS